MKFFKHLFIALYGVGGFVILTNVYSCASKKSISENKHAVHSKSAAIVQKYSKLLDVPPSQISNIALYTFIDEWYGIPYKFGGQNKNGIDCSNFAAILYSKIYHKTISGSSSTIFNQCSITSKKNLQEGDLIFFKIEKDKISHIGIYLQNNKFVHATTKKGVIIDDLNTTYYSTYFYKAGCLK